jgi:superoxide dismutase, Cu-Zn family
MQTLKLHSVRWLFAAGALGGLLACGESDTKETSTPPASATVSLAALNGSTIAGSLTFTASGGNVVVTGSVTGLPPGVHGLHVHDVGNCGSSTAADGTVTPGGAAGGHWNPGMHDHGAPEATVSHLGDLGNITADASGKANVSITKAGASVSDAAATDVVGHAVVVHANPDDLTSQPVGNAGGRIACGVIQ